MGDWEIELKNEILKDFSYTGKKGENKCSTLGCSSIIFSNTYYIPCILTLKII